MDDAAPVRGRRRWARRALKGLAALLVGLVAAVALLPTLAGLAPARRWIVGRVNGLIAPSKIELATLRLSWFGPSRLGGLVLRDPRGKAVLTAPRVVLDRSLVALARDRARLGTLTLESPTLDIERRPDGSIDLVEALVGHQPPDPNPATPAPTSASPAGPGPDVTLKVVRGTLKLSSPELAEPIAAERLDLTVRVPAVGPLSWTIALADGPSAETLTLTGRYDPQAPAGTAADLEATVTGKLWPLALDAAGVQARGRLDGTIRARRAAGLWSLDGDARLIGLDASGPALAGDRLRLDRVAGAWDVAQTANLWEVRRLEVTSPVATLKAGGSVGAVAGAAASLEGQLDLAALAGQIPHALRLREGIALERGAAHVRLALKAEADGQVGDLDARITDLVARDAAKAITLRAPATLSGRVAIRGEDVQVERLAARAAFLDIAGAGDLDRGLGLTGSVDLGGLQAQLRDLIDFGDLELAGRLRLAADYRRKGGQYAGRLAAEFDQLSVAGLTAEPIRRTTSRIEATASGPAAVSGRPLDWSFLRLGLTSDDLAIAATANRKDEVATLTANASGPLPYDGREGRAEAQLSGRWDGRAVDFDAARLAVSPPGPAGTPGAVALSARGRYDVAARTLTVSPIPGAPAEGLTVAADGFTLALPPGGPVDIHGGLSGDLARLDPALAAWTGEAARGMAGALDLRLVVQQGADGRWPVALTAAAPNLTVPDPGGPGRRAEPLVLTVTSAYTPAADRLEIHKFLLGNHLGYIDASGTLDEPSGRRLADLAGTLVPNWDNVRALVASATEPTATVTGNPRAFRIKGPLAGGSAAEILKGLDAELGLELTGASAFGVRVGPAPIVVRCAGGNVAIDPIRTTINDGPADLRPVLRLDDPRGLWLALAPGSTIQGAKIDNELSSKLLTYIAPVLQEAAEVNGQVSATFQRAEYPIGGDPGRTMTLVGQIVFQDVTFRPGPFAAELTGLIDGGQPPVLRIHQPLQLTVADGRVSQSGLVVTVAPDVQVVLEGSVGFDQTLALKAGVPITSRMLGGRAGVIGEAVGGTRVGVPIGGTLTHPRIDRQALQVGLRDAGRSILKRGVEAEASKLLERVAPSEPGSAPTTPPGRIDARQLGREVLRDLLPPRDRP